MDLIKGVLKIMLALFIGFGAAAIITSLIPGQQPVLSFVISFGVSLVMIRVLLT